MFGLVPSEQVPTSSLPTLRVGPLPLTRSRATTPSKHTLQSSCILILLLALSLRLEEELIHLLLIDV